MTGPLATATATAAAGAVAIARRLAGCYTSVPADAVVSSGHAFLCRLGNRLPEARTSEDGRIARTLASLARGGLVPVGPRVWATEGDDLLVRLDGFGPVVDMDADAARRAILETLRAPAPTPEEHRIVIEALRATASTLPAFRTDVSCSAPMAWRPACIELDPAIVPDVNWWSGTMDFARNSSPDTIERSIIDPDIARLLPRIACATEASVTIDDRIGLLLRPVSWGSDVHPRMGAMEIMRTFTALADMLASHDPAPTADAADTRPRHEATRPIPTE
jgi:hypothetical protein